MSSNLQNSPFFGQKLMIEQPQSSKPAFLAYLTSSVTNVTGDSTTYIVLFNNASTAPGFDNTSNFNVSTGLFTAPSTGNYVFSFAIQLGGLTASHTSAIAYIRVLPGYTNPDGYLTETCNVGAMRTVSSNNYTFKGSSTPILVPANSTVGIGVQVSNGTKVVGITGGTGASFGYSWFAGYML